MTIKEIFEQETARDVIVALKQGRGADLPKVDDANKALDPEKHKITDASYRPDKKVKVDVESGETGDENGYKVESVARIKLAIQKLIIKRAVSFCFGNPIDNKATPDNDNQILILKALKRILHDNKSNSLNRKAGRAVFGYKECAELWYPVEKENNSYGFNSKFKLRCALFTPANGDELYPYWDETGDLIAFSREFTRKDNVGKTTRYFETYTDELHWLWIENKGGFDVMDGFPKPIAIGKIPIVYGRQNHFETQDVDSLIDRLELLLSNFADTNDYHAAPKIFIKGELKGFSKKGESGAIIEGDTDADAKYLSWQNAPESVKLEIETLLKMIYTITQTPDISFDSVKGLGAISGIALKLLFMDAHLKVQDKKEIFDDYMQRRVNIIKAYIGSFNETLKADCEALEIEPEIKPYMLTDEINEITKWVTANGGKAVVSQKASVQGAALTKDPDADFDQIQSESTRENSFVIGEPMIDA